MKLRHKALAVVLASCVIAPMAAGSAFAPSAQANDLENHWGRLVLVDTTTDKYIGIGDDLKGEGETDLYEAESDATFFDMPKPGKTATISNLESGEYLKADSSLTGGIDYVDGSILDAEFNFEVDADGAVKTGDGKYLGFDEISGRLTTTATDRFHLAGSAVTDEVSLVANLDSFDADAGTAELSGTATSGFLDEVKIAVGDSFVTTQPDGSWVMHVSGIKPTDTKITVIQTVNNTKIDEREVALDQEPGEGIDLPFALGTPKDGDTVIAPNNTTDFTGTGTTGDTVTITNTWNDRVIGTSTIDDKGTWTIKNGSIGFGAQNLRATVTPKAGGTPTTVDFTITVTK